jgi:hypothetical protein
MGNIMVSLLLVQSSLVPVLRQALLQWHPKIRQEVVHVGLGEVATIQVQESAAMETHVNEEDGGKEETN